MSIITDIERGLIARYLTRLLIRQDLTLRSARNLLVWLNERSDVLSLPLPPPLVEALGGYMAYKPAEFEKAWIKHKDGVVVSLDRAAKETPRPEPMATNVERLVENPTRIAEIMGDIGRSKPDARGSMGFVR